MMDVFIAGLGLGLILWGFFQLGWRGSDRPCERAPWWTDVPIIKPGVWPLCFMGRRFRDD